MRPLRSALLTVLLVLALPAQAWSPTELMQLLAQQKSGRASFVEKKYLGIVDKPVESSGTLAFTAPDRLEKRTLKPKPEALLLASDRLTVEREGKPATTVRISSYPEAAAFVDSIRGTLAGDLRALERSYWVKLSGERKQWRLELQPRSEDMDRLLTRVAISGEQGAVQRIEFEMADGDRTEMLITPLP
ncbi:MAG: acyltransferase [Candidatus Dactylopiibacterium carminicum]|uniref:Acyltransferase n=1 Tax=Candidatus Dactylopiibacterium carminicum TaxID=857335 RepID=A0A272EX06_9RHOO|nr:outer membrane lipoprotein carrier protein LolA [Candidatus Dactylopiibacterium carminicum]KAF7600034.1 outer membrane lipoprotein carrier protein LolA [Candidatus Dactylopiibacterium carminicum]PAS94576.1 MAG: acyltransferase [Candidatus Dactylopiibacterium carminicum]PAT00038.1 MAG: acyltransferase [Candidatus Dactylopiibacterium carminicum]